MAFTLVPVLDLMGGQVVRAVAGERARYRPLQPGDSVLVAEADPFAVVRAFLHLHPFRELYLADLDAIAGHSSQLALVQALEAAFPRVTFWLDAGVRDEAGFMALFAALRGRVVVGSETLTATAWLRHRRDEPRLVLSLDHRGPARLGPAGVFQDPALWPQRVIVMTLAAVGTGRGPEWDRIQEVLAAAGGRQVYAAGGVRGRADLEALRARGCAGALVASCLHRGTVAAADLKALGG